MKKVISLIFAVVTAVTFSACGNEGGETVAETTERATEQKRDVFSGTAYMEPEEKFAVTDKINVALKRIVTTNEIEPTMNPDYKFENDGDKVMIDVVFEAENVGNDEVNCCDLAQIECKSENGEYKEARYFFEYNNYRSLAEHTSLKSGEKTLFHAVAYVSESERSVTVQVVFNEAVLLYDYELFSEVKSTGSILLGEKTEAENKAITVTAVKYDSELHPSATGTEAYTYHKVDDEENTYIIAEVFAENNTDEDIDIYDFANIQISTGSETVKGIWVCEKETGEEFDAENLIRAKSGAKAYYIAEIPKRDIGKQYDITIVFNLEEYRLKRK